MWLSARTTFATLSTAVAVVVGCGGNVIVDGNGGSGGDGGQGGVTLPTGTATTSTGNTGGNTGSTASTGGTGGIGGGTGGNTGGMGGATTITSSTITTSTVPSPCDNTGECGDGETGCLACAIQGPCEGSYYACIDTSSCIEFSNCFFECNGDAACQNQCSMSNPEGAQLYTALLDCAFCEACPIDCTGSGIGCF